MPKPERGEGRNGKTKSVRITIKSLEPGGRSGKAVASPRRLDLHPGEKVIWTFAGLDGGDYRPDIRFPGPSPVGRLKPNGNRVESEACTADDGTYAYEVRLVPREGFKGAAIELAILPEEDKGGRETVRQDPLPPDIQVKGSRS